MPRLGVLGWPVAHSRSPAIHNAALRALGMSDWRYQRLPVPPQLFAETTRSLHASGFVGANVTIPHKQAALELADRPSEAATAIGAANTLMFAHDGTIAAENTDAPGLIAALQTSPRGMRVLILGAGGSARAVAWALRKAGAGEVSVWNRTPERARALARDLGVRAVSHPDSADVLINCTSVGLERSASASGPADASHRLDSGRGQSAVEPDTLSQLGLSADRVAGYPYVVDMVYRADGPTPATRCGRRTRRTNARRSRDPARAGRRELRAVDGAKGSCGGHARRPARRERRLDPSSPRFIRLSSRLERELPELMAARRSVDVRGMDIDFADLLMEVVSRRASDLHLSAAAHPTVRVRGRLTPLEDYPKLSSTDTREIVYSILTGDQRQRLETNWQLDFAYSIPGHARFRVNAYYQRGAIGAAFRLIPFGLTSIDDLGLPPAVHEFTRRPRGFVLVTGPTGSGKSTSLAAMIDEINRTRAEHIMTIEDPIEFLHTHKKCLVNQRELGSDAHSFADALKAALREDPDVILVGEMRDLDTISTALTAAETGHLVFATLHTQDSAQTIDRVIDVFPAHQQGQVRVQLSVALQGIMTQQLLPTADGSGRVVACEVLVPNPAVRNLIREGKTHQIYSVLQTSSATGMQTMDSSLATLVRQAKITRKLAEARSSTPEELGRLLGAASLAAA